MESNLALTGSATGVHEAPQLTYAYVKFGLTLPGLFFFEPQALGVPDAEHHLSLPDLNTSGQLSLFVLQRLMRAASQPNQAGHSTTIPGLGQRYLWRLLEGWQE